MNNDSNNQPMGFWRDWYARIALGLLLLAIVDLFIPDILVHLGVWPTPTYPPNEERESFSVFILTRFVLLPVVIAFLLLVVAAGRLLRRKKIF